MNEIVMDAQLKNTGAYVEAGEIGHPFLTLTQGGVVVAQTLRNGAWAPGVLIDWSAGDLIETRTFTIQALRCDPSGATGSLGSLPSGTYQLWAASSLRLEGAAFTDRTWSFAGPWEITLG